MKSAKLYEEVFERMKKELADHWSEISIFPVPFTTINKIAMLAATIATDCLKDLEEEPAVNE